MKTTLIFITLLAAFVAVSLSAASSCTDRHIRCKLLAKLRYCQRHPSWMRSMCTESCGWCPATWGEWQEGDCSVTCGEGVIKSTRTCSKPGKCQGEAVKTKPCDEGTCLDDLLESLEGVDENGNDDDFLPPPYCSIAADVLFVVDSSTYIGAENFALIKSFVREVVAGLDISGILSQVSLVRYTSWPDSKFFFNTFDDKLSIMQAIDDTPYYGQYSGLWTGAALHVAHSHHLQSYNGWRGNNPVPTAVIVVTDSITQDPYRVRNNTGFIHSKATRVIAVGVGAAANVEELRSIATAADDVLLLDDFFQLNGEISTILDKICEMDGDVNECMNADTNNCAQVCSNTMSGFFCECFSGYTIIGDTNCENINECANENGGCSHTCTDNDGSFTCSCPENMVLADNGLTCDL